MNSMKLLVVCLFAVCCCSLANREPKIIRKLKEVLNELKTLNKTMKDNRQMVHSPKNIENCCSLKALDCFQNSLKEDLNASDSKLYYSLGKSLTRQGIKFCDGKKTPESCRNCTSYSKENLSQFFSSLESLIQKSITRLSLNKKR
uniref:Interleukin-21 n=1 Tax=Oryzias sinensis TaxID=183150 RepID=A0A8C8DFJ9_9TELE